MEYQLKPCPFCDGKAEFYRDTDYFVYIECTRCCATMGSFVNKEDATKAWNTRTEHTCKVYSWDELGIHLTCGHDNKVINHEVFPYYCPICGARVEWD